MTVLNPMRTPMPFQAQLNAPAFSVRPISTLCCIQLSVT